MVQAIIYGLAALLFAPFLWFGIVLLYEGAKTRKTDMVVGGLMLTVAFGFAMAVSINNMSGHVHSLGDPDAPRRR